MRDIGRVLDTATSLISHIRLPPHHSLVFLGVHHMFILVIEKKLGLMQIHPSIYEVDLLQRLHHSHSGDVLELSDQPACSPLIFRTRDLARACNRCFIHKMSSRQC